MENKSFVFAHSMQMAETSNRQPLERWHTIQREHQSNGVEHENALTKHATESNKIYTMRKLTNYTLSVFRFNEFVFFIWYIRLP